jgi:hypothetical protein
MKNYALVVETAPVRVSLPASEFMPRSMRLPAPYGVGVEVLGELGECGRDPRVEEG